MTLKTTPRERVYYHTLDYYERRGKHKLTSALLAIANELHELNINLSREGKEAELK